MDKKAPKEVQNLDDLLWEIEQAMKSWSSVSDPGSEVNRLFSEFKKKTKTATVEVSIDKMTDIVFKDILKFDDEQVQKFGEIMAQTMDIMNFETEIPEGEIKTITDSIKKICDWYDSLQDISTVNPFLFIQAKKKLIYLRARLWRYITFYGVQEASFTINRRATRSAVSVGIRQFSKDKDYAIKKLMTVTDSENFGEVITSCLHKGELTATWLHSYLDKLDRNIGGYISSMDDLVNWYKFEMRASAIPT